MAISATCTKCLQVLKVAEKFAGRKALCPLCENAVAIPKEGEKAAAEEGAEEKKGEEGKAEGGDKGDKDKKDKDKKD